VNDDAFTIAFDDIGRRVVADVGEAGAFELLEALTRPETDRAALVGRLVPVLRRGRRRNEVGSPKSHERWAVMPRVAPMLALVVVLGAAPAPAAPRGGGVRLQKIAFDPPGADDGSNGSLNEETVVIVNDASSPVNMTGWTLRDRDNHVFRFPTFTLRGGARVTVHNGSGIDNATNLYWSSSPLPPISGEYIWNNDGDTATLRRRNGSRVDGCAYSGSGSTATC
jgi:hypothetical protein